MKKVVIVKIQTVITALLLLTAPTVFAQTTGKVFTFKKGNTFLKQTALVSTSILQRGNYKLTTRSVSKVVKSYLVENVTPTGQTFNVSIIHIIDTVQANGNHLYYDSGIPPDTLYKIASAGKIVKALAYMINKPSHISIDQNGVIAGVNPPYLKLANDTLLALAGIEPEVFSAGNRFSLISNITQAPPIRRGFKWTDVFTTDDGKTTTTYSVDILTDRTTTISFKTVTTGKVVNTNTNGVYVISNTSGIIIERVQQSVSVGYQTYNGVIYTATRRCALSESCYNIK